MTSPPNFDELLSRLPVDDPQYATQVIEDLLQSASNAGASDLHFQPSETGLQLKWRVDGVLQPLGTIAKSVAANVIVRIKVLAKLLTYETNLPQEGRITQGQQQLDIRVSTFPTIFGEKVVARFLQTGDLSHARLADLGLPADVEQVMHSTLTRTSGALLIVGPAGSGKTTTAYACLREIIARSDSQRNLTSMEDPVEAVVAGVAQSEVSEAADFNLTSGLRSLVRQDPDVIFVGEIRDPDTANIAFQAALTGQLVITTFHASDSATAISRLTDMGVPPYVLRSAIQTVVAQQLVRCLCDCATPADRTDEDAKLGLRVESWKRPQGCEHCLQTGYSGRQLLAEVMDFSSPELTATIQDSVDAKTLQAVAKTQGMKTLHDHGTELVANGQTSPAEITRVLGLKTND